MSGGPALRFSAALAAAALLAPNLASAQAAAQAIQPGQRLQEIDLIGEILYDSNVASSDAALAAARGLTPSDELFEPKVHVELSRPIGRETFYLLGDAGYIFHARNTVLNRENIDINPGVLGQIGPCQTGLSGEYSRAQSDLSELSITPAGLDVRFQEKNVLQVEEIGGQAACLRATGFGPSVTASETWTDNSSPVQRLIDAQTFSESGGLTYQRPVLGSVRLFGAFSHTDFPNRAALIGVPGAGLATSYQTISGGVTYTRAVGSRLQGSVSLSYTKLTQEGSTSSGFSGATYSAALQYAVSSRLRASTTVSRATVPSNRLNSTFGIDEIYSGQLIYDLTSRLSVDGGASYNHNTYNGVPYPVGFDVTDEKYYTLFGDVNLKLTRRLIFGLDARHLQRNANFPGLSFPETRVGLTARAIF